MTGRTKTNSKDDRPKVLSGIGSRKGRGPTKWGGPPETFGLSSCSYLLMITSQEYSQEQP